MVSELIRILATPLRFVQGYTRTRVLLLLLLYVSCTTRKVLRPTSAACQPTIQQDSVVGRPHLLQWYCFFDEWAATELLTPRFVPHQNMLTLLQKCNK